VTPKPAAPDPTMRWALYSVAVVATLVAGGVLLGMGVRAGLGAALGGAIAVANLAIFSRVVRGLLAGGRERRLWGLVGIAKIFVLFGGLWLLLRSEVVPGITLVLGYGALPVGLTLAGLLGPRPNEGGDEGEGPPEEPRR
jgi:hypothetical protein